MFGKKKQKEEDTPSVEKETKKSKKQKEEAQNINTNKLKIVIFRYMGEDLAVQVGKPIIAEEKKDSNNNLLAINEGANFKEDLNFSVDRIYEVMNFSLKMQNKTNNEKALILKEEIKKQEELLLEIENTPEMNANHNFRDEELKLKQLKIFYDSLRKEKKGNYMRLGEGGIRQFEFVAIDGILYPYFFGAKRFRVYPDLLVKKKIFNHENTVFKNETAALFQNTMNWMLVVLYIIAVVLIVANVMVGYWTWDKSSDMDIAINRGSETCLNALGTFTANYGTALNDYMKYKSSQTINQTKTTNIIKNEIPIINIDPNKLGNN